MAKEYFVGVQLKRQENTGEYYNLKALLGTLSRGRYYTSLTTARKELKEYIAKQNKKGARTERSVVGGIGILMEVTEEEAQGEKVVNWWIRGRKVTPWEDVDRMK